MKKMLIVTTVSGFVPQFEMSNVRFLQKIGYEVHYASNFHNPAYGLDNKRLEGTDIIQHQVDFVRSPFLIIKNIKAYYQLLEVLHSDHYKFVHCHTPMGAALSRLAVKKIRTERKIKVIYTAHGFHFYKGAPIWNWILYYPVERYLSRLTDIIITINDEDFSRAKKFKLYNGGKVYKINGVGINRIHYYSNDDIELKKIQKQIRDELGISKDSTLLISVGELSARKNHKVIIKAISKIKNRNVQYLICGIGKKEKKYRRLINKLGLENKVILCGYRNDIPQILTASDCFVFPSKQEGLPVALMEAMRAGLPVICSDVRGNRDLIRDCLNGYLVRPNKMQKYIEAIKNLLDNKLKTSQVRDINEVILKDYYSDIVNKQMGGIYDEI